VVDGSRAANPISRFRQEYLTEKETPSFKFNGRSIAVGIQTGMPRPWESSIILKQANARISISIVRRYVQPAAQFISRISLSPFQRLSSVCARLCCVVWKL